MSHTKKTALNYTRPRPFLVASLIIIGIMFFIVGSGVLWVAFSPIPDISSFGNREVTQSTKIYDRSGTVLLYDYNRDKKRDSVPLSEISPFIQKATIAIEDSDFYSHGGIRISSIIRAMLTDILGGSFEQGGSTITQQVVKNTMLTNRKNVVRKVHEWVLAIRLEQVYSKDKILQTYLNEMPYGGTLYGVEAASEAFFGKEAKNVDLAQASYLASLLQAPSYYSPYGKNREALEERHRIVLKRMLELQLITKKQYLSALEEKIVFNPQGNSSIIAPHFVFYIISQLKQKYGDQMIQNGLNVITTLNIDLQNKMQDVISTYGKTNVKNFKASNAASVAIDPKTGQILAMVGSRDYFNTEIDGSYNDTLAMRQPGSTFKPFVYAVALEKGFTRRTTIFDLPTQFSTACSPSDTKNNTPPCYAPSNFDDSFRGPMTFTTALAQSINIPAVKTLYLTGIKPVINLATASGITSIQGDTGQYGLSFALGAADVSLLDITDAYGTFANSGVHNPPTGILSVTDAGGKILSQYRQQSVRVMPPSVANDISAMLSDNKARFPEYPPINPLNFPGYDVAVKTGTTDDYRDAWTIGYTPSIVIGTWAGNNDNSPMVKQIAGYIVAPMWHQIMKYALTVYPKTYFGEPSQINKNLPPVLRGQYLINQNGNISVHNLLYWVNKNDPKEPQPKNPSKDPQFSYWEYPIAVWESTHTNNIVKTNVSTTL